MPTQCPGCGSIMYINEGGEETYLKCSNCGAKITLTRVILGLTPLHTPETLKSLKKKS